MERKKLFDLYEWDPGICFRHPDKGVVDTTVIRTLRPRLGPAEDVRACHQCVAAMEAERHTRAKELGVEYEPGRAGTPPDCH
ncbi:hypothetical protein [Streptomyces sp900116325]|uniref:hypothetical protein n=1 Tax=Streptomyces sp. 900116325 TaxID=3154295 RepID=UPI0033B05152